MSDAGRTYRFGPFTLDAANAELTREGVPVKLAPQPFTVLLTLLDHPGALVTRDQLRRIVWGDAHHVDFNAGLNYCLAQIRAALDDPSDEPAYIVTVPRRGYRFIADVDVVAPGRGSEPAIAEPLVPLAVDAPGQVELAGTPRRRLWLSGIGLATACLAVAGLVFWRPGVFATAAPESTSLPAVSAFERGALALADASPEELRSRVRFFEEAVRHDPQFARAYAGMAEAQLMLAEYRGDPPQQAYAMAKASAQRALALSPDLPEAHAAMAAVLWQYNWDWAGAERHVRIAERAATSPSALVLASRFRTAQGRSDLALPLASQAVALAPRSARAQVNLGMTAMYAGDYARATEACQRASALIPKFVPADMCLATVAAETRQLPLALRYERVANANQGAPGNFEALWRDRLVRLQAHRDACQCDHDALSFAIAYARLGDTERALTWLERAAETHSDGLVYAAVHPALRSLRDQTRFQVVVDRVGAPAAAGRVPPSRAPR